MKWVRGKHVKLLVPGLHIYWPLMTEVEVVLSFTPVRSTRTGIAVLAVACCRSTYPNRGTAWGYRRWPASAARRLGRPLRT